MAEFRLDTQRLFMRDWKLEDAEDFHRLHRDAQVMATLGPLKSCQETAALIKDLISRSKRNGGYTYWPLVRRNDGRVIGFCGLDRGSIDPVAGELEIGWRLASDC